MATHIFKAIQAVGLDPNEFDLKDLDDGVRIKHKRSASYFIVRSETGYYVGQYFVGDGVVWPTNPTSWQTRLLSDALDVSAFNMDPTVSG